MSWSWSRWHCLFNITDRAECCGRRRCCWSNIFYGWPWLSCRLIKAAHGLHISKLSPVMQHDAHRVTDWEEVLSVMLTRQQQRRQQHSFNGRFSRTTRINRWAFQNVFILDFIEARMMEVVVTPAAVRHPKLHHRQINIHIFTRRMPFLSPNQQRQSTEGINHHTPRTCSSPSSSGIFRPFLHHWRLLVPGPLVSPLTPVPYII